MKLTCAAAVMFAMLFATATANAQTDAQREEARRHFTVALDLVARSSWAGAVTELEAARDLAPTLPVYFNLGISLRAVGRHRAAIAAYLEFLRLGAGELSLERASQVEVAITDLRATLGHIDLHIEPANATVRVDGEVLRPGETEAEVDPGAHIVAAEAVGFRASDRSVEVRAGTREAVSLVLVPTTGHLIVETSNSTSTITIDGEVAGRGRIDAVLAPGRHLVEVRAAGYDAVRRTVQIVAAGETRSPVTLVRSRRTWVLPVTLVAGSAAAAGATVLVAWLLRGTADPMVGTLGTIRESIDGH